MTRWLAPGAALVAIIVGIALSYQSAAYSSRTGSDAPLYSARRYDPYGTAALKDLLTERGIPVRTLERPSIESSDHGVLIQVLAGNESILSQGQHHPQTRQLSDWVAIGNTVVQFTRHQTDLMQRFKIAPSTQPVYRDADAVEKFEKSGDPPSDTSAGVALAPVNAPNGKPLLLWSPMVLADQQQPAWTPIAHLDGNNEAVVAGEFRVGKGKLIVIGAPTPALNGMLGDQGNLEFLLRTVGNGPVIIDEWSHGIGHEATIIGFIHDAGLLPVLLQLAFLAILYGWSSMGFSRRESFAGERQRSSVEQIETLGFLYSRSLGANGTFDRVRDEVFRRMADALRCPPGIVRARLATLNPQTRNQCEALFLRLEQIGSRHAPRCLKCHHDLSMTSGHLCLECGTPIPIEVRQRIENVATVNPSSLERRRVRIDKVLADVLTLSHQLAQEVQRERRAVR